MLKKGLFLFYFINNYHLNFAEFQRSKQVQPRLEVPQGPGTVDHESSRHGGEVEERGEGGRQIHLLRLQNVDENHQSKN